MNSSLKIYRALLGKIMPTYIFLTVLAFYAVFPDVSFTEDTVFEIPPSTKGSPQWRLSSIKNPCFSAGTLDTFLAKKAGYKFSKSNPVCPFAIYHHIHILIPFYKIRPERIVETFSSVLEQKYQVDRLTVWIYDDASGDSRILSSVCNNAIYEITPQTKNNRDPFLPTQNISIHQSGPICLLSTLHLGPGKSSPVKVHYFSCTGIFYRNFSNIIYPFYFI